MLSWTGANSSYRLVKRFIFCTRITHMAWNDNIRICVGWDNWQITPQESDWLAGLLHFSPCFHRSHRPMMEYITACKNSHPFVKGCAVVEFELFKTFSYINDLAGQFSSSHQNQMNKDGRSQIMADLQSGLSRGGAAQVKLRESEQKHRGPEVTNGILTSSQWRFTIYIVTSLWLER